MVLRLCFIFALLLLGCSNSYERDNPTDPIHVYSVSFNLGEAAGLTPPETVTGSYGDSILLPGGLMDLKTAGYVVTSWKADSIVKFKGITDVKNINYAVGTYFTITSNIVLEAVWVQTNTATFDGNGATSGTAPEAITRAFNSVANLPWRGNLEKTGYAFAGWSTDSSGAQGYYKAGHEIGLGVNSTYYAIWISCSETNYYCDTRDGQGYKTTTIGTQVWMAENLNYSKTGIYCFSSHNDDCAKYGSSYDWVSANRACPEGWHLPSKAEWEVMTAYIGGAGKLRATSGWNYGNGTDEYGFSALPGGYGHNNSAYHREGLGSAGYWWSASEYNSYSAYCLEITDYNYFWSNMNNSSMGYMLSVRCLRDAPSSYVSGSSSSVASSSSSVLNQSSSSSVVPSSSSSVPPLSSGSVSSYGSHCTFNGSPTYCQYDTGCFVIDTQYAEPQGRTCFEYVSNCIEGGTLYIGVNETTVVNQPPYGFGENCKTLGGTQVY